MNTVWDLTHSIQAITWEVNKQFATILQIPVPPGTPISHLGLLVLLVHLG